jgi:hypothetical protein
MTEVMIVGGKSGKVLVTGCAGKVTVFGKAAIVEQFLAQFKTLFGKGVIGKRINGCGKSCGNGKR